MNKKQKTALLNQFVSDDYLRSWMQKPFKHKQWLCATDGSRILFLDAEGDKCDNDIAAIKPIFAKNLDDMLQLGQQDGEITKADIVTMIGALPKTKQVVKTETALCPECEGAGEVEGTYYSDYYHREEEFSGGCPVCEGSGEIEVKLVGKLPTRKKIVTLKGIFIKSALLWDILSVMDACKVSSMAAFTNKERPSLTVQAKGATLLMMGCLTDK